MNTQCCRFTVEFNTPSLYVWEIQLEQQCRGKGLGKHFMRLAEMIAVQAQTPDVVLCVQESNAEATAFYSKLGYKRDDRFAAPDLDSGYAMFHKSFQRNKV